MFLYGLFRPHSYSHIRIYICVAISNFSTSWDERDVETLQIVEFNAGIHPTLYSRYKGKYFIFLTKPLSKKHNLLGTKEAYLAVAEVGYVLE